MDTVLSKEKGTRRPNVYATITATIIEAIEAGAGTWHMPWHAPDVPLARPRNVISGLPYKGVNILVLWAEAQLRSYPSGHWATYRQWQELGAQVRKGERGTTVLYYKQLPLEAEDAETGDTVTDYRLIARAFRVFNGAQVDGGKPWEKEPIDLVETHRIVEDFIDATGADIRSAGTRLTTTAWATASSSLIASASGDRRRAQRPKATMPPSSMSLPTGPGTTAVCPVISQGAFAPRVTPWRSSSPSSAPRISAWSTK